MKPFLKFYYYFVRDFLNKNKKLTLFFKASLSFVVIFYFFKQINFVDLEKIIYKLEYYNVAVLFIISLLMRFIWSLRYYILLKQRIQINILDIIKQIFIVSFSNNFLPSAIGGDGIRIYFASKMGVSIKEASFIVILERIIGLFSISLIGLISSFFWDIPGKLHAIIIIINFIFFILIYFIRNNIESIFTFLGLNSKNDKINYDTYLNMVLFFKVFILSLSYHFVAIFISYYTAISVEIVNISLLPFLSLMPLVWIMTLLPITLGGIGLREFSLLYLFSVLNFSHEDIFTISLGTYLTFFFSSVIGLLIIIYEKIQFKKI